MNPLIRCVLTSLIAGLMATTVSAQVQRNFPATALRGTLQFGEAPLVLLNGQPARMSPGARIRDAQNLLVVPGALAGQKVLVNYTLESLGLVHEVWLLRADEAARKPWPTTPLEAQAWRFDPVAQTWVKP